MDCAFGTCVSAELRKIELMPSYSSWPHRGPGSGLGKQNQTPWLLWPGQRQKNTTQQAFFLSCSYLRVQKVGGSMPVVQVRHFKPQLPMGSTSPSLSSCPPIPAFGPFPIPPSAPPCALPPSPTQLGTAS